MIEIRFAKPADAATILSFVRALAEYEKMPHAVETNEETLAAQLSSSPSPFECLLAEEATPEDPQRGTPVGFALLFHTYSTWRGRRGIWLEDLFVLPEWRRRGVGRMLLDEVVSLAKERGCGRVEWSVLDWNEPAIGFYRAYGADMLHEWRICRMSL
jgi:GNAT superfamily N-acetyltransferase